MVITHTNRSIDVIKPVMKDIKDDIKIVRNIVAVDFQKSGLFAIIKIHPIEYRKEYQ